MFPFFTIMVDDRGPARHACRCVAIAILLLAGCSTLLLAATTSQRTFSTQHLQDSTPDSAKSSTSPNQSPLVHLSHSGVYISSPISRSAPQYLALSVDSSLYDVESVKVTIGRSKQRNWEQTHLECGGLDAGGIEACEKDDLREMNSMVSTQQQCEPYKIIPSQSRVLINTDSCPSLNSLLDLSAQSGFHETYLDSVTLSFEIQRVFPTRKERHSYWIGKLVRKAREGKDGGALWPYVVRNKHDDENAFTVPKWNGRFPNTITEQMQDPYMPKSYKAEETDVLNGVDLISSTWSYGISILSPTNGNVSKPTDRPRESVHAPIGGQIVWMGTYNIPRAPGNHRNDENGYALMIRDEWGFVYQLLGLDETQIYVKLGQMIDAGHVIGSSSRSTISQEPPCRHKPADPPEMYDNSRRYPHRNRVLRIRVSRPDSSWKEWKAPSGVCLKFDLVCLISAAQCCCPLTEIGWQYFNPLDAFTTEHFTSHVPVSSKLKENVEASFAYSVSFLAGCKSTPALLCSTKRGRRSNTTKYLCNNQRSLSTSYFVWKCRDYCRF